jgi:hypothetical protein
MLRSRIEEDDIHLLILQDAAQRGAPVRGRRPDAVQVEILLDGFPNGGIVVDHHHMRSFAHFPSRTGEPVNRLAWRSRATQAHAP